MESTKVLLLHGGTGWDKVKEEVKEAVEGCADEAFKEDDPLEMVVRAVKCMEDSGKLNAGAGATLDLLGKRSLDAGVACCGKYGAVANVKATKNAILLAKFVMDLPPHLIAGPEADELARLLGLPPLPPPPEEKVREYLEKVEKVLGFVPKELSLEILEKFKGKEEEGTVGAVALAKGKLAAATSTGGILLKLPGRVGDTPILGAGYFADDLVACSTTGIGAKIVRVMPCLRLREKVAMGKSLEEAGEEVLKEAEELVGPSLGMIAVTSTGEAFWGTNLRKMIVAVRRA